MAVLCKKAKELKGTFLTFQINHVLRVGLTFSYPFTLLISSIIQLYVACLYVQHALLLFHF